MRLSQRLDAAQRARDSALTEPDPVVGAAGSSTVPPTEPAAPGTSPTAAPPVPRAQLSRAQLPGPAAPPVDALARLKDRAGKALFERMGARLNDPSLCEDALRRLVLGELDEVVEEEKVPLTTEQRPRLIREVEDDVLGHGPLQRLLDDPSVTEIMVNGPT